MNLEHENITWFFWVRELLGQRNIEIETEWSTTQYGIRVNKNVQKK